MKRSKTYALGLQQDFSVFAAKPIKVGNVLHHRMPLLRDSNVFPASSVILAKNKLSDEHNPSRSWHFRSPRLYNVTNINILVILLPKYTAAFYCFPYYFNNSNT